ncbi:hypothetical protein [Rhizobium sp.]
MDVDPWARKKKPREETSRNGATLGTRIAGYVIAMVTVGAVVFAGFEMLMMA